MKMQNNPCYGCDSRSESCHSTCWKYIEAKLAHDKKRAKLVQARNENDLMSSYVVDAQRRMKKSRHIKRS